MAARQLNSGKYPLPPDPFVLQSELKKIAERVQETAERSEYDNVEKMQIWVCIQAVVKRLDYSVEKKIKLLKKIQQDIVDLDFYPDVNDMFGTFELNEACKNVLKEPMLAESIIGNNRFTKILGISKLCFLNLHMLGVFSKFHEEIEPEEHNEKEVEEKLSKVENTVEENVKEWKEDKMIPHFDFYLDDHAFLKDEFEKVKVTKKNLKRYVPCLIALCKKHLQFLDDVVTHEF